MVDVFRCTSSFCFLWWVDFIGGDLWYDIFCSMWITWDGWSNQDASQPIGDVHPSRRSCLQVHPFHLWKKIGTLLMLRCYMGVSENGGFSPQIIQFNRDFHYKSSILGYPCFWKHPYIGVSSNGGTNPTNPWVVFVLKIIKTWGVKWGVPPFKETAMSRL